MTFADWLTECGACNAARAWVADASAEDCWERCSDAGWMRWLLQQCGLHYDFVFAVPADGLPFQATPQQRDKFYERAHRLRHASPDELRERFPTATVAAYWRRDADAMERRAGA